MEQRMLLLLLKLKEISIVLYAKDVGLTPMKEHNIEEEWPPIRTAILALCILYEREPALNPFQDYPEKRYGNYLLYWETEDKEIAWKDPHTNRRYYEVHIKKWWTLEND